MIFRRFSSHNRQNKVNFKKPKCCSGCRIIPRTFHHLGWKCPKTNYCWSKLLISCEEKKKKKKTGALTLCFSARAEWNTWIKTKAFMKWVLVLAKDKVNEYGGKKHPLLTYYWVRNRTVCKWNISLTKTDKFKGLNPKFRNIRVMPPERVWKWNTREN